MILLKNLPLENQGFVTFFQQLVGLTRWLLQPGSLYRSLGAKFTALLFTYFEVK